MCTNYKLRCKDFVRDTGETHLDSDLLALWVIGKPKAGEQQAACRVEAHTQLEFFGDLVRR